MPDTVTPVERSGQSNSAQGAHQDHTLIALVEEKPGAIDRVVGLMRRRRANMQTLVLGRSEQPDVVRVTVSVNDSEVAIDQLVEQLRKLVDVRYVYNITARLAVTRELALIKLNSAPEKFNSIIELAHHFGAHVVDVASDVVTLEVTGSEGKIEKCVNALQEYGIREIARSGRVAMARGSGDA
jgi:acetolactate synthase I/III small subunit